MGKSAYITDYKACRIFVDNWVVALDIKPNDEKKVNCQGKETTSIKIDPQRK